MTLDEVKQAAFRNKTGKGTYWLHPNAYDKAKFKNA